MKICSTPYTLRQPRWFISPEKNGNLHEDQEGGPKKLNTSCLSLFSTLLRQKTALGTGSTGPSLQATDTGPRWQVLPSFGCLPKYESNSTICKKVYRNAPWSGIKNRVWAKPKVKLWRWYDKNVHENATGNFFKIKFSLTKIWLRWIYR